MKNLELLINWTVAVI